MTITTDKPATPHFRDHPRLGPLFREAESRHFRPEEIQIILAERPDLAPEVAAVSAVREIDLSVIQRVVKEVFAQFDYEQFHDYATAKCTRDIRYVITYACAATVAKDLRWFDDKLLIWLKTILAAFNFPARTSGAGGGMFADEVLEERLKELPQRTQSTFYCYYRLRQEMEKELAPDHFRIIEPSITLALNVLTEPY